MKLKYTDTGHIINIHTEGIPYLSFDMLDAIGCKNLYTSRLISYDAATGEGKTGFRTVVMATEDRAEAEPVTRFNTEQLARQIGADPEKICITNQKHTANVFKITEETAGWGRFSAQDLAVDGQVTDVPGAVLVAYGADCPPVYIADPVRGAIGLVHAGRKGTLGRIPAVAAEMMMKEYGSRPEDMYAAVGIGICMDCYEMGDEIYDEFAAAWGKTAADKVLRRYPAVDGGLGRYHLDLRAANLMTLEDIGIPSGHIAVSNVCTCCNTDIFYSYRARKMENEQLAMLVNDFR